VRFEIVHAQEVGSTNDVVAARAAAGAREGLVVVADAQRAGRGRMGRTWFSPPGSGLYVSVLLRPPAAAVPLLTLAGGVALCEAVRAQTGLGVVIKWPNDLLTPDGTRKLAGILVEGAAAGPQFQHVVFGYGINLRASAYPADIRDRAASLEEELGRPVDAASLLDATLAALDRRYRELIEGRGPDILARWLELAPHAYGTTVQWITAGEARRGVTAGIDQHSGALLVSGPGGIERIVSGEVTWCFSR